MAVQPRDADDRPQVPAVGRALAGGDLPVRAGLDALCNQAAADFAAWRDGDESGLARLVHALTPMLWHVVRAYRLDHASAEDVVQATWFALVRHRSEIKDGQAIVRWLTVTARREAWRVARAADAGTRESDLVVLELRPDPGESPDETVERRALEAALWAAVASLPERCRRLLRVVAFSERPDYAALARQWQIPVGSIGPTRGRCLAKLRALIDDAQEWSA